MSEKFLVRLVDDDEDLLAAELQSLKIAGFRAEGFSDPRKALEGITPDYPGVILSDVRMPGMDGFEFHRQIRAIDEDLPVILLTGHGDVPMAVEAMRAGAWDFLTKPVSLDQLTAALRRAAQARALVLENRSLRQMKAQPLPVRGDLLGVSPAVTRLRDAAARIGEAGIDALITGPTGAGKEALAHAIHRLGSRANRPFVHVACDTLNEGRFDSEFFGAEAGHPDAPRHSRLVGRIEKAHRGTLYLDRVEMLTAPLQARLLHAIETRSFWAAGATSARPLDLHVLASTSADLGELARQGSFHADLYYRLSGVTLHVPPLAGRRGDIAVLFRAFLIEACQRYNLAVPEITPLVRARLDSHDWPGNGRELRQFAEAQALGLTEDEQGDAGGPSDLAGLMARYEAGLLRDALRATKGNVTRAMAQLNLPRKTFYDKLAKHGLQAESFRERG